jgi:hypothetical protein
MRVLFLALVSLSPACRTTPIHKKGDRMVSARVLYGTPIVGHAIAWDGGGDADTVSGGLYNHWFVTDRLSIGTGATATYFFQEGGGVWGGEIQGASRWHFTEWGKRSIFWDLNGGFLQTEGRVPPNSTEWNFTFAFGPGIEWPLNEKCTLLTGVEFHHLSNAYGRRSPRNQSQNELRFWIGLGWMW